MEQEEFYLFQACSQCLFPAWKWRWESSLHTLKSAVEPGVDVLCSLGCKGKRDTAVCWIITELV